MRAIAGYAGERTSGTGVQKHGETVVMQGSTGGIACTLTVDHLGAVEVLLEGLPECLTGTRPFLSFPLAGSVPGIAWSPGPLAGIVRVAEKVTAERRLRCLVARSRSRWHEIPGLLSDLRLMSEEGESQPLCAIGIRLRPLDAAAL